MGPTSSTTGTPSRAATRTARRPSRPGPATCSTSGPKRRSVLRSREPAGQEPTRRTGKPAYVAGPSWVTRRASCPSAARCASSRGTVASPAPGSKVSLTTSTRNRSRIGSGWLMGPRCAPRASGRRAPGARRWTIR
ncbi:hypothetical protein NOK12_05520 [Nocardioides sp. OK12]|nr:hypothetical protein NOK12_05520 [Nocardioides sp. OK12]